jgi:hypothetical protein
MKPADPIEGMLMSQLVVVNEAALKMYRLAWLNGCPEYRSALLGKYQSEGHQSPPRQAITTRPSNGRGASAARPGLGARAEAPRLSKNTQPRGFDAQRVTQKSRSDSQLGPCGSGTDGGPTCWVPIVDGGIPVPRSLVHKSN